MNAAHKPLAGRSKSRLAASRQSGFSLVEILVGLLIGLIGILVIFQVFAVSEGQKRTTESGSDAQQNGTFALYTLERAIRSAGQNILGTNDPSVMQVLLGCTANAYNGAGLPAFPIVPVLITAGAVAGASDTITAISGSASGLSNPVSLTASAATGGADTGVVAVSSVFGFNAGAMTGDFVITAQSGKVAPQVNCTVSRITAVTPDVLPAPGLVPAGTGTITHEFGAAPTASPFNTAFAVGYLTDATVFNIGPSPVLLQFSVAPAPAVNNQFQLQATDLLGRTAAPAVLADGIVNMQAQYGIDTSDPQDDVIDSWQPPTLAWASGVLTRPQITQIKAIRIGIVTRSGLFEKPDPTSGCSATTSALAPNPLPALPTAIPAKPAGQAMDTTGMPNWRCYRYRTYETVIPIRNAVLSDVKPL